MPIARFISALQRLTRRPAAVLDALLAPDKLRRVLGWAPQRPLEDNLLRVIDYYRTNAPEPGEGARAPEPVAAR